MLKSVTIVKRLQWAAPHPMAQVRRAICDTTSGKEKAFEVLESKVNQLEAKVSSLKLELKDVRHKAELSATEMKNESEKVNKDFHAHKVETELKLSSNYNKLVVGFAGISVLFFTTYRFFFIDAIKSPSLV